MFSFVNEKSVDVCKVCSCRQHQKAPEDRTEQVKAEGGTFGSSNSSRFPIRFRNDRHSKSVNTEKEFCWCGGKFELLVNKKNKAGKTVSTPHTPRAPSKFALFVKENYATVKKGGTLSHKDTMKQLSDDFAKVKLNFA